MKSKIFKLVFCMMLTLGVSAAVFAGSEYIKVSSVNVTEASDGVVIQAPTLNDDIVSNTTALNHEGDFASYLFQLSNSDSYDYSIDSIEDDNENERLSTTYSSDGNIAAGSNAQFSMRTTYADQLINEDSEVVDDIKVTVHLSRIEKASNPDTFDGIIIYFVLAVMFILLLCALMLGKNRRKTKIGLFVLAGIFASFAFLTPRASAAVSYDLDIYLTNIRLMGEYEYFEVVADYGDGIGERSYQIRYGDALAEAMGDSCRDGYHITGWTDADGNAVDEQTEVTGPLEIFAEIEPNTYVVSFDANSGAGEMSDIELTYDQAANLPANAFTKLGYDFTGWASSADGDAEYTNQQEVVNLTTEGSFELFATWTPRSDTPYLVIHRYQNLNGGFDEENQPLEGTTDSQITPAIRSRVGFDDPNVQTTTIAADGSTVVTYDYLRKYYSLELNDDEFIETETHSGDYMYGTHVSLTATDRFEHDFLGWSDGENIISTDASIEFDLESDTELTVVYERYPFYTVFRHDGACEFNGTGNITGEECQDYADQQYIDTGVKLFSAENYHKDFEIGFEIVDKGENDMLEQLTLVNAKDEEGAKYSAGLAFRWGKDTTSNYELSHTVNGRNTMLRPSINDTHKVRLLRVNDAIYYEINDGGLVLVRSVANTDDYHDIDTWFGASYDAVTDSAFRYFDGAMSHMYIKLGTYDGGQYSLSFDPQGGEMDNADRTLIGGEKLGTLPVPTKDGVTFAGWYYGEGGTVRATKDDILSADTVLYARWIAGDYDCEVNGEQKATFAECVSAAGQSSEPVDITLLRDAQSTKTNISSDQNINLNLSGFELKAKNGPAIENYGQLRISDGKISTTVNEGAINNNSTGSLYLDNVIMTATRKQTVYNTGGYVEITGNSSFNTESTQRATLQNQDSGTMIIRSGSVTASGFSAINNVSGTLTIGSNDGAYDTDSVLVRGAQYAIMNGGRVEVYDGKLMAKTQASVVQGSVAATEAGAVRVDGTESFGGDNYYTLVYELQ